MRPAGGDAMASRCVVVIRGGRKPWVVESTCSLAEVSAEVTPLPIFTFEFSSKRTKEVLFVPIENLSAWTI